VKTKRKNDASSDDSDACSILSIDDSEMGDEEEGGMPVEGEEVMEVSKRYRATFTSPSAIMIFYFFNVQQVEVVTHL